MWYDWIPFTLGWLMYIIRLVLDASTLAVLIGLVYDNFLKRESSVHIEDMRIHRWPSERGGNLLLVSLYYRILQNGSLVTRGEVAKTLHVHCTDCRDRRERDASVRSRRASLRSSRSPRRRRPSTNPDQRVV